MDNILIDTNIVVWYFGDYSRLSDLAETTVDKAAAAGTVFVSPITIVELIYLIERNRVPKDVLLSFGKLSMTIQRRSN